MNIHTYIHRRLAVRQLQNRRTKHEQKLCYSPRSDCPRGRPTLFLCWLPVYVYERVVPVSQSTWLGWNKRSSYSDVCSPARDVLCPGCLIVLLIFTLWPDVFALFKLYLTYMYIYIVLSLRTLVPVNVKK